MVLDRNNERPGLFWDNDGDDEIEDKTSDVKSSGTRGMMDVYGRVLGK